LPTSSRRWVIIVLMMQAVRTSETSVNICLTTRQHIPEDSKLCTFLYFSDRGEKPAQAQGHLWNFVRSLVQPQSQSNTPCRLYKPVYLQLRTVRC
jgi:hypothetical protein